MRETNDTENTELKIQEKAKVFFDKGKVQPDPIVSYLESEEFKRSPSTIKHFYECYVSNEKIFSLNFGTTVINITSKLDLH